MKKTRGKRNWIILLSVVLVAALAIGTTLAYLSVQTDALTNGFTFVGADPKGDNDMKAKLTETDWNEDTSGKNLVPGSEVKKNPVITNTSDVEISEWVALKITFQRGDNGEALTDAELEALLEVVSIDWNTTDWSEYDGNGAVDISDIYYYNTQLAQYEETSPLFRIVTISEAATNKQMDALIAMGGFNIYVEGAALQGDMGGTTPFTDAEEAKDDLAALFVEVEPEVEI
ncbi:hypothetical protein LJC61_06090 [Ruminococcaceae bacterium OttesenSCG-928-A16]|nr:hypothetical protein [Ruminococcaceae bacterium OttesenSCG-928-A16]